MSLRSKGAEAWCRLLVVDHGLGVWGAQLCLLRLAPLLAAQGVEQILAAPSDSGLARRWQDSGREYVPITVAADRALRGAGGRASAGRVAREAIRNLRGAHQIARVARRVGADVLVANSHGWSYLEVVAAAALSRRPAVVNLHLQLERSLLGKLWGTAISRADTTIAVSTAVTRTLPSRPGSRVHVVPNGVDPEVFSPGPADPWIRAQLTDDPAAPVVLVLARLEPQKGIDDVIRAVASLPPPLSDTRLAVAGASSDPPDLRYETALRARGRELLGERVRFLGVRPDPQRLIRAADAVALASQSEGFGLCILETQACGKPPVAYPAGGVGDLITHGVDGLLARQGDVTDLSRNLAAVLGDREYSARLGIAARRKVLAEGALQRQADSHVEVLREVVGRRRSARADGDRLADPAERESCPGQDVLRQTGCGRRPQPDDARAGTRSTG